MSEQNVEPSVEELMDRGVGKTSLPHKEQEPDEDDD